MFKFLQYLSPTIILSHLIVGFVCALGGCVQGYFSGRETVENELKNKQIQRQETVIVKERETAKEVNQASTDWEKKYAILDKKLTDSVNDNKSLRVRIKSCGAVPANASSKSSVGEARNEQREEESIDLTDVKRQIEQLDIDYDRRVVDIERLQALVKACPAAQIVN